MSLAGEQEPSMDTLPPDPLLKPGAFIDPNPISNDNFVPQPEPQPQPEPASDPPGPTDHQTPPEKISQPSDQTVGSGQPRANGSQTEKFDWLPPGWTVVERVRASGASAGTKDKYYVEPVTKRRFRSKKEVLSFLQTGGTPLKRKKNAGSDAETTPQPNSQTAQKKQKKTLEMKAKDLAKRFNFDDVPAKVKWELTDVYEGAWQPLLNSVDKVSKSSRQEWAAAFTYLTLPDEGSILL